MTARKSQALFGGAKALKAPKPLGPLHILYRRWGVERGAKGAI